MPVIETRSQSAPAKILVVDDDRDIRILVARVLEGEGYRALTAPNVEAMAPILRDEAIDLILLDVMMPGEDGLSACARLERENGPPVVLMSALGAVHDRVRGLELGASHYLSKPCGEREIVATVKAALRARGTGHATRLLPYLFEGWQLDNATHELTDPHGVLVSLTDGEFAMLRALVERPRRVLTREALLEAARGPSTDAFDRAVDVSVSRIRRKLSANGEELIRTIRNEGYMFVAEVTRS